MDAGRVRDRAMTSAHMSRPALVSATTMGLPVVPDEPCRRAMLRSGAASRLNGSVLRKTALVVNRNLAKSGEVAEVGRVCAGCVERLAIVGHARAGVVEGPCHGLVLQRLHLVARGALDGVEHIAPGGGCVGPYGGAVQPLPWGCPVKRGGLFSMKARTPSA